MVACGLFLVVALHIFQVCVGGTRPRIHENGLERFGYVIIQTADEQILRTNYYI